MENPPAEAAKQSSRLKDDLLTDLNVRHELNVPLALLTWYGIGGPARVLAHPSTVHQLSALAARCREQSVPVYVLGAGANLLVADAGVDGVVIQLDDPAWRQVHRERDGVTVGCGYDLMQLVRQTARDGLRGLQVLAGIPASVGGAVRMNAGGSFGEIGKSVRRVQAMDATGHVYYRHRDDLVFSYRKTNITAPYILEVEFDLTADDPKTLVQEFKEIFLFKRNSQPLAAQSAGCAFKNPPPGEDGETRSAGTLIDRAGFKGYRVGGAEVSLKHANFVVTDKSLCTASDVLTLLDYVQQTVAERFGVMLEREIVVWK